ncbi:xylulokinase [Lacrimispora indolis]|uniref:xylulokinase n=1 Tax=Lacrimispora indolis TaxID=69825 RepID=UPI00045EBCBF|nr:FGGY-family carbohydrate kinase [Lacrimispora indolis]
MDLDVSAIREAIENGRASLGIELGSTRIKAVLIGENHIPLACGGYDWENRFEDRVWTYSLEEVKRGLTGCYRNLAEDVKKTYGVELKVLGSLGISGMMHGYLVFDKYGRQLAPFRTWRNTITGEASARLTEIFAYPIPQRWSIAHLYQSMLNQEDHVKDMGFMTTLSGYVHWLLTGQKVLGVGDASGMFPIDIQTRDFNSRMLDQFDRLAADTGYSWKLHDILPKVLSAGENAGVLSPEGAGLLDPSGQLKYGVPLCPPEGDAGTGMAATNSVRPRTGNVSAGTSVFSMIVLEKELAHVYEEIDLVTTPAGDLVAMVHCNNCTSDLNAWISLFGEFLDEMGYKAETGYVFSVLYNLALTGDKDCGGLLSYGYLAGEHITGFDEGRPLFVRMPDSRFNLANFIRVHLFTSLGALKTGMDILFKKEGVKLDLVFGHGGLFKTKGVGQSVMAAAMNVPVSVMDTAGEGGAWGIALLASYMIHREEGETLEHYLENRVFSGESGNQVMPDPEDTAGFEIFMERYTGGLAIERAAVEVMKPFSNEFNRIR